MPRVKWAVGCHPSHAGAWSTEVARNLRAVLSKPDVLAVGECGVDLYHRVGRIAQLIALRAQLLLAAHHRLPVVLHCREAAIGETEAQRLLVEELRGSVPAGHPLIWHSVALPAEDVSSLAAEFPNLYFGVGPLSVRRHFNRHKGCLLYTSPSLRDLSTSRMPSSA